MVTIRLSRGGMKKQPFYHVVVTDGRQKRDGRCLERVGFYNPVARGDGERLRLDMARIRHWQGVGAQASDRVTLLMREWERTAQAPAEAGADAATQSAAS